jgi:hypothetical protein
MITKTFYQLYCGVYAREAKAVALWESDYVNPATQQREENPEAISPGGLGIGMMGQSIAWQHDYPPTDPAASWFHPFSFISQGATLYQHAIAGGPWHPAYQLACYFTFCTKHNTIGRAARWRLYHYGHAQDIDPDGYAARVMTFYDGLAGW